MATILELTFVVPAGGTVNLPLFGSISPPPTWSSPTNLINWGDGSSTSKNHTYTTGGTYIVTVAQPLNGTINNFGSGSVVWAGSAYLTSVGSWANASPNVFF